MHRSKALSITASGFSERSIIKRTGLTARAVATCESIQKATNRERKRDERNMVSGFYYQI